MVLLLTKQSTSILDTNTHTHTHSKYKQTGQHIRGREDTTSWKWTADVNMTQQRSADGRHAVVDRT